MDNKTLDDIIAEATEKSEQTKGKKSSSSNDDERILIKDFPRKEKGDKDER